MARRNNTLAGRLSRTAVIWGGLALFLTGLFGICLFASETYAAFVRTLSDYRTTLAVDVAAKQSTTGEIGPRALVFSEALSGWYWTIADVEDGSLLAVSGSLQGELLRLPDDVLSSSETQTSAFILGPLKQPLQVSAARYVVDGVGEIDIAVAGPTGPLLNQIRRFAIYTVIVLSVLTLGLVFAIKMQVKVGLRPLEEMRSHVESVRTGDRNRLDGDYPADLAPIAVEVNAMIGANEALVERAQVQAGNLAHALKTPLSVLTNDARKRTDDFGAKVIEQLEVMREQVDRHLMRARRTAQATLSMRSTQALPAIERLAVLMQRVYAQKDLAFEIAVPAQISVRADAKDFDDIVGNVLDNACKWTCDSVVVRGAVIPAAKPGEPDLLRVSVEDNGPGLPQDKMAYVLERGKRLDEQTPGSGLGLSIVKDLTGLYGGRVILEPVEPSGLRVILMLPIASLTGRSTSQINSG